MPLLSASNERHRTYENRLRALGHELDRNRFTGLAVIETPLGFVVKGMADVGAGGDSFHTTRQHRLIDDSTLTKLCEQARQRRRR